MFCYLYRFLDLKHLLSDMQGIKHDQDIIRNNIQMLNDKLERYIIHRNNENEILPVHWTVENNIKWPLKIKEEYDRFNILLQDETIRKYLYVF